MFKKNFQQFNSINNIANNLNNRPISLNIAEQIYNTESKDLGALDIWYEKLAEFEHQISITTSLSAKFELTMAIDECKRQIEEIEKNLKKED